MGSPKRRRQLLKHEMYLQVYESRYLHNKPEVGEGRGDVGKLSDKDRAVKHRRRRAALAHYPDKRSVIGEISTDRS